MIHNFLAPTFATSPLERIEPSTAASWEGLGVGTLIALAGIGIAYQLYVRRPGTTARRSNGCAGCTTSCSTSGTSMS